MYFWRRGGGGEGGKERQKSNRTSLSSFGSDETRMCVSSRWGGSWGWLWERIGKMRDDDTRGVPRADNLPWKAEVPEQPVCAWACGVSYLTSTIIAEVVLG
jgi:hypothetical protein